MNQKLYERAKIVTPVAAQTFSKGPGRYFTRSIFLRHGKGVYVWDTEGNKYLDMCAALGPVLIGHSDKRINKAIKRQLKKGISLSLPTEIETELCEKLTDIPPGCEMVRLMKNGSDVTAAAVRLARTYTGRDNIIKCGYHGWADWTIAGENNCVGIPEAIKKLTYNMEYGNIGQNVEMIKELNPACVILEPIQKNGTDNAYLGALRKICTQEEVVLVFDEVVSGFRTYAGSAAKYYNVIPDLMCIGKAVANGMPISAVCGRKDIVSLIDKGCFISTTFGGETLSIAAALETIKILENPLTTNRIHYLGILAKKGLEMSVKKYKLDNVINVVGTPPRNGVVFNDYNGLDYLDYASLWNETMLDNGILTHGINYYMLAMKEKDILKYLEAAEKAILKIQIAAFNGTTKDLLRGKKLEPIFRRN